MKNLITNTNGEKIAVEVDSPKQVKGLAFVAHGLGGFKEQPHIVAFSQALNEAGYLTIRWDARKTMGESEGELLDATLTNYLEDFETVADWVSTQDWYEESFVVCGHSLGAACALLFSVAHPEKVKALIPASAFISGSEFEKTLPADVLTHWKQTGIREWMSSSQPGVLKRLKWSFMEDAYTFNLLNEIKKITQPTLLIVGSNDKDTPVSLQKNLFNMLSSSEKELRIIEGAEHTFKDPSHLNQIKEIVKAWMNKIS
jgi:pimeloyl-ACP methyl ester carboxylesterase